MALDLKDANSRWIQREREPPWWRWRRRGEWDADRQEARGNLVGFPIGLQQTEEGEMDTGFALVGVDYVLWAVGLVVKYVLVAGSRVIMKYVSWWASWFFLLLYLLRNIGFPFAFEKIRFCVFLTDASAHIYMYTLILMNAHMQTLPLWAHLNSWGGISSWGCWSHHRRIIVDRNVSSRWKCIGENPNINLEKYEQ